MKKLFLVLLLVAGFAAVASAQDAILSKALDGKTFGNAVTVTTAKVATINVDSVTFVFVHTDTIQADVKIVTHKYPGHAGTVSANWDSLKANGSGAIRLNVPVTKIESGYSSIALQVVGRASGNAAAGLKLTSWATTIRKK